MARTAGDPRVRYIAFRLDADDPRPIPRKALIEAIRRAGQGVEGAQAAEPWLTRFDGTYGIVRCAHTGVAAARLVLERLDTVEVDGGPVRVAITTLATSGTIRTLTDGPLKALKDTGRRR